MSEERIELERRRRIRLCLFAYAYELEDAPIATDAEFDELARLIDPSIKTGHEIMDQWFATVFEPHTGSWIHDHPELDRIKALYQRLYVERRPLPPRRIVPTD